MLMTRCYSLLRWNLEPDLTALKAGLQVFGLASGLFTNMQKNVATPIDCSPDQMALVSQVMECSVADFPRRYLGGPLSIHRLRRCEEQFLIDAVASRIPGWKGKTC